MDRVPYYMRLLAFACVMVAILGIGVVFVIGYRPPTFGRVATIILLIAVAVALWLIARRIETTRKG